MASRMITVNQSFGDNFFVLLDEVIVPASVLERAQFRTESSESHHWFWEEYSVFVLIKTVCGAVKFFHEVLEHLVI